MPLSKATGPDVMAEIARRRKSAVLLVFETPRDGVYNISEQPAANVRCFRTPDMSSAQLMQVLAELSNMSQGQPNASGIGLTSASAEPPFELLRLGRRPHPVLQLALHLAVAA